MSYESTDDRLEKLENQVEELVKIQQGMIKLLDGLTKPGPILMDMALQQFQFSLSHHKVLAHLVAGLAKDDKLLQSLLAETAKWETQIEHAQAQIVSLREPPNSQGQ